MHGKTIDDHLFVIKLLIYYSICYLFNSDVISIVRFLADSFQISINCFTYIVKN